MLKNKEMIIDLQDLDFQKNKGLIPVIVQDNQTEKVLMLGYMNPAALEKTQKERRITFFRS